MESLVLGISVGLVAGFIPGAYSTVVAATALERGTRTGLTVALIPLLTEMPALVASSLILTRLPTSALRWIGMGGGGLLLGFAWSAFRKGDTPPEEEDGTSDRGPLTRAILFGLLSPGPWAFWFFLGGPLLLSRWRHGWTQGVLFLGGFFVCFLGALVLLAWGVGRGREYLNRRWYRWTIRGVSAVLAVVGVVLIWQSWAGNFADFVQAPPGTEGPMDATGRGPPPGPRDPCPIPG
jgi:threonine/homoserine/homoserine lactone efflux protein